ncbi:MAG: TonB family protein [Gammaproteobacteria bacterium]|nr:MAG: TonB family protein [Gammaproteobacteria bacterium]UTW42959.1 TonB family protein [bacterium SCSIO 12844]
MKAINTIGWLISILAHLVIVFSLLPLINDQTPLSLQPHSNQIKAIIYASLINTKKSKYQNKHQEHPLNTHDIISEQLINQYISPKAMIQSSKTKPKEKIIEKKPQNQDRQEKAKAIVNKNSSKNSALDISSQPTPKKLSNYTITQLLKSLNQQLQLRLWQINPSLYQNHHGYVLIRFILTPKHSIKSVQLIHSSGYSQLDTIAIKLLKNLDLSKTKIPPIAESIKLQLPVKFEQGL